MTVSMIVGAHSSIIQTFLRALGRTQKVKIIAENVWWFYLWEEIRFKTKLQNLPQTLKHCLLKIQNPLIMVLRAYVVGTHLRPTLCPPMFIHKEFRFKHIQLNYWSFILGLDLPFGQNKWVPSNVLFFLL